MRVQELIEQLQEIESKGFGNARILDRSGSDITGIKKIVTLWDEQAYEIV